MPRTKGSKNKKPPKPTTKTIAVRLTDDECAALAKIHKSPSKAIHALISRIV